ncbi:MAG TPA: bifunctional serine/threonine-protein kinase/formylglycine-generating enzyme family protein [Pyrinomonadaceae bacterium]|nr:bifunctional serine/threonine-protein kinase/formylglycine-generating enzyme family protein [Pyrinomonadaceae bacterium]
MLERRLGQGGMGVVFQARHIFLKTSHAIKVILPDLVGNDPMLTTRFRQEALAAAAIRHPNIITVTDFGVVRGTMPFLVMEFVKGRSLQDILAKEGAMPPQRAWEYISAIASGVGAAHRQNIVHRDLKPLNIMVQDDVPISEGVKILDFGLAKIKSGELLGSFVQAQTSGLMGSPFYMAPEQWSDDEPDARADIYSLGVILYQMLAGEVPFKGSSIPSIMKKHLTLPPPSFQSMGASVPPAIESVVRHALEKEVEARIDSVPTFLSDLHAALNSSPVVASALKTTVVMDPNKTMASVTQPPVNQGPDLSATSTQPPIAHDTQVGASFDSMAGTVSGAHLDKMLEEGAQRKQREEQERLSKERQERERREKEQQEKFDRMALQAQELEDRLERLSGSMPPSMDDPETTRVQGGPTNPNWAANSARVSPVAPAKQQMIVDFSPKRKTPPLLLIGATVMVLVLAGVGISAYLMLRQSSRTVDPTPTPTPVPPPKSKADLISIDGGTFLMGRKTGPPQETPAHAVTVQQFLMDRTEVSNTEYADFVRETNHTPPAHWIGNKPPFGQETWPVVNVTFTDATEFAAWRSKRDGVSYRLPTEEEWEYAARNGERADLYPWGPEWKDGVAVLKDATPSPVGSRADGKNRWGVFDLIGNVWEWTASKASVYPGNQAKVPKSMEEWVTIRGGCYVSDPTSAETPISSCLREFVPSTTKTTLLGFRLVRSG